MFHIQDNKKIWYSAILLTSLLYFAAVVTENIAKTEKKENIIYFNKKWVVSFKVRDNVKKFFNWREIICADTTC